MDKFKQIYKLLKYAKYAKALAVLLDKKKWRIKGCFAQNKKNRNQAWYVIGDIFFKIKRYKEARKAFVNALMVCPRDVAAMHAVGNCYDVLKHPDMAERYFRKGLLFADSSIRPKLIYNLGNAFFDQGKYEEAIEQYKHIRKSTGSLYELARKNLNIARKRKKKANKVIKES